MPQGVLRVGTRIVQSVDGEILCSKMHQRISVLNFFGLAGINSKFNPYMQTIRL